jgi:L-lactate dehydrogenase (cytochrome)
MIAASASDFRELARRRLPLLLFDYLDGGSYAEATLKRNVEDMAAVALRQRVLRDVSNLSMGAEWFGQKASMPLILGPVGFAGMFSRRGEVEAARVAREAGVPLALSTLSICSVEEVTRKSGGPVWYQLYIAKDRGFAAALLRRVAAQASPALLFTVDLPVAGARYRDVRSHMSAPPSLSGALSRAMQGLARPGWLWDVQVCGRPLIFGNLKGSMTERLNFGQFAKWIRESFDASLTWKDIGWIRQHWKGPIVLKGILDPEDAKEAVAVGADGIIVSNHGGRQLDGALSSIRALPAVVDAVGGRIPVLMDGGVRSGLDVLRAMALGARGCLIGRAWAYALAAQGGKGVRRVLEIFRQELAVAMALTGCTDVRKAGKDLLA